MKYERFSGSDLHLTSFIASSQAQIRGCNFIKKIINTFFVTAFLQYLVTWLKLYFPNWLVITTLD